MNRYILALGFCLISISAAAQNATCPDKPLADSSNACANTRFVHGNIPVPPVIPTTYPYTAITGVPAHRILGNNTGSTAPIIALTGTQATTELDLFTSTLKGLTPLSGGGTTKYLRADGTWQIPPVPTSSGDAVYSQDYGVLCNGSTDDSANMQTFANAAAGRIGVIQRGVCRMVGVFFPSNSIIQGQGGVGSCSTTLQRPTNTPGTLAVLGAAGSMIRDLCIDGNFANNQAFAGFVGSVSGNTLTVTSVSFGTLAPGQRVSDFTGNLVNGSNITSGTGTVGTYGIQTDNGGGGTQTVASETMQSAIIFSTELNTNGTSDHPDIVENVGFLPGNYASIANDGITNVINCYLDAQATAVIGGLYGVLGISGPAVTSNVTGTTIKNYRTPGMLINTGRVTNNYLIGNHKQTAVTGGGQIATGGPVVISNNIVDGSGSGSVTSGLEINGTSAITGNVISNNQFDGINIQQSDAIPPNANVSIAGNVISSNGHGIRNQVLDGTVITGNKFFGNTINAIVMSGTSDFNVVTSNVCRFNTAGIANTSSGSSNAIANNPGC